MKLSPQDDVYERIAALLPTEEIRRRFLLHIARVRTLPETDEILLLIEACGYFTLLSAALPERMARTVAEAEARMEAAAAAAQRRFDEGEARMRRTAKAAEQSAQTAERVAAVTVENARETAENTARGIRAAKEGEATLAATREEGRIVTEVAALLRENSLQREELSRSVRGMARFRAWASTALLLLGVALGTGGGRLLFGPLPGAKEAAQAKEREWEDFRQRMENRNAALAWELERLKAQPPPVTIPAPAEAVKPRRSGKN